MTKEETLNKVKGAFYGLAIGDAMGATTEFMTPKEIRKEYGAEGVTKIIGGGWLNVKPGAVTDDTQMSMCVASAILSSVKDDGASKRVDEGEFLAHCRNRFLVWYACGPIDIGNQCRRVLSSFYKYRFDDMSDDVWTGLWYRAASNKYAYGNGSLMRALPAALVGEEYAVAQGRLTHNNKVCDQAIRKYCNVLQMAMQDKVDRTVKFHRNNGGAAYETLDGACYWFARTKNFADCIIGVVNDGGDADTIGAVAGSIAGCYYGFDSIPQCFVDALKSDVCDELDEVAHKYIELGLVQ